MSTPTTTPTTTPTGISTGTVFDAPAWQAHLPAINHAGCEACPRMICRCPSALCTGFADDACDHGRTLCDNCRPACEGCRDDARQDGGNGGALVAWIPVPFEDTVPADGDQIVCKACDGSGGIRAHIEEPNPDWQWDSCDVCGGTGSVPFAAVLGGVA